ncbi:NAD-dependent epimerase/dehydratase family protein [Candidatus Latescibacterota bacterium]
MTDEINGRKILVVGGAGFVGSNLVKKLLTFDPAQIVIVDNLLSAEFENIPDSPVITFIEGSITDDTILNGLEDDLDYVFHLATFHGNQNSIHDPLADHENNTLTTLKLFDRVKNFNNISKVVYASAGCTVAEKTFDEAHATSEDEPVSLYLDSPYQISKIIGEFYANYYFNLYDLPVVKARFQNVYGPGEILGAGQWRGTNATVWRNVTPTFIYKAINGEGLPVEGNGEVTRDFIYVEDIVDGLIACALKGAPGGVFNLASGVETSIRELAETINEFTLNETPIDWQPGRDWDRSGKRFGCTANSKSKLGFEAKTPLHDGLSQTIEWMVNNRPLIDNCIAKYTDRMKS